MNECDVIRYYLENENVPENIYEAQKLYFTNKSPKIRFNENQWLAINSKEIFSKCETIFAYKKTPIDAVYIDGNESFSLIKNYKIQCNAILKLILHLKITHVDMEDLNLKFNEKGYFTIYRDVIESFYENETIDTYKFYCEYGYWNNLEFKIINPYIFIASYLEETEKYIDTPNKALEICFKKEKCILNFDPYVYIASNYEELKEFVDCFGNINEERVTKYYIRNGKNRKQIINFNYWEYLANNPKRIMELMERNKNEIYWDIFKVTQINVAKVCLKHHGKFKHNQFKDAEFVKTFVDDLDFVNKDKKLSLENSCKYFVNAYVKFENVRYKYTFTHRVLTFIQGRLFDSVKQVPFNAARFIISSKCI